MKSESCSEKIKSCSEKIKSCSEKIKSCSEKRTGLNLFKTRADEKSVQSYAFVSIIYLCVCIYHVFLSVCIYHVCV
jgi:hypothetical protein